MLFLPRDTGFEFRFGEQWCTATAGDWVVLILSLILIALTWWVLELPKLVSVRTNYDVLPGDGRARVGRVRQFLRAIGGNCARILMPSYVAIIAMARNRNPRAWARLYYFGYEGDADEIALEPFTAWEWARAAGPDIAHVVTEVLLIYQSSIVADASWVPPNYFLWLFTSTPGPLLGLYLLVIPHLPIRMWAGRAIIFGFVFLSLAGIAMCVSSYYLTRIKVLGPYFGAVLAYGWASTMLPFPLSYCCNGTFHFYFYTMSAALRAAPFIVDLSISPPNTPFCTYVFSHPAFISVFAVFSLPLPLITGFLGGRRCEAFRPQLSRMARVARTATEEEVRSEDELAALEAAAHASDRPPEPDIVPSGSGSAPK